MRAMVLHGPGEPLMLSQVPLPVPGRKEILIKVKACGVCRTDLHILDGELPLPKFPLIPGHQIVGEIVELGPEVTSLAIGQRVGVPWLWGCCENLCDQAVYNGYQRDGGFAEYTVANERFCFPIPDNYSDLHAAPLLCAGLIGYRALKLAGSGKKLGFYGFGSAAHIITQAAVYQERQVFAFTREGDETAQRFALELGAKWAGSADDAPPELLDAAIIFAPIGDIVPKALSAIKKGGTVVCAGIHMSDIPSFSYSLIWGERVLRSVANLTRQDGIEFLDLAPKVPIKTQVSTYPLEKANEALKDLKEGRFAGSAVIIID